MNDNIDCPLCLEPLGDATSTLKCGHQYCTECLLNSVAKNTGTPEGNTRINCAMCRAPMCDEIEPSAQTAALIENYKSCWERDRRAGMEAEEECHNLRARHTAVLAVHRAACERKTTQIQRLEVALQRQEHDVERLNFVLKRQSEVYVAARERIIEKSKENQQLKVMLKQVTTNLDFYPLSSAVHDLLSTFQDAGARRAEEIEREQALRISYLEKMNPATKNGNPESQPIVPEKESWLRKRWAEIDAATILQCLFRCYRARRKLKYRQIPLRWQAESAVAAPTLRHWIDGAASKLQSIGRGFVVRRRRLNARRQAWADYKRRIGQLYDELLSLPRMPRDPREHVYENDLGVSDIGLD
jgi:hypothetical protein